MDVKFPQITVNLSECDGNAFSIMGAVTKAMKRAGVEADEINAFRTEAMSGDYNNLLQVAMKTVNTN